MRAACCAALFGAWAVFGCTSHNARPTAAVQGCHVETAPVMPGPAQGWDKDVEDCAYAPEARGSASRSLYSALSDGALEVPPQPDILLAVRSAPSFSPSRSLSLRKTSLGEYVLRSIRLRPDHFREPKVELEAVGNEPPEVVLPDVDDIREVHERLLDARTAELLLRVMKAQVARERQLDPKFENVVSVDGTAYRVWQNSSLFEVHSPAGSLGRTVAAVERLARIVDRPAADDCAQLASAYQELREALARAARPCQRGKH